jgi:lipopolysaccharide export system permease protein
MIPFIISIIVPFVTFIATIFVYNKLIGDNEITVLAATGASPRQIAKPAIIVAIVLTLLHWILAIWTVPSTQARFYDTQWELRYGLAHIKLQEAAFTELASGLVVYVDKVSGHDLSQLMLSDMRDAKSETTVFADKGKLIATARGLSIVMGNGSLTAKGTGLTVGKFETFDMDLNVASENSDTVFKVRRISTRELIQTVNKQEDIRHHELFLSEICTRLLSPIMNLILAGICVLVLLKSSLLRRRASFAPVVAVGAMAGAMALFMSASNMLGSLTDLVILAVAQFIVLFLIIWALFRKA